MGRYNAGGMTRKNTPLLILIATAVVCPPGASHSVAQAPAAPAPLAPVWEIPVPDTSTPFVTGIEGGFAVATRSGRIAAYTTSGGAPRWQVELGSSLSIAPVSSAGRLAVAAGTGAQRELILIDVSSGATVSRHALPGDSALFVSAIPSGFAVASSEGSVTLIDAATGAARWSSRTAAPPSAAASLCGDSLLVGGADGTLMAFGDKDGAALWHKSIGERITTRVTCELPRAYVGSADNRLHALKLRRRGFRERWSYPTGGDISGAPLIFGDKLLFFSFDTYLYALESGEGHLAWKARMGRRPRPEGLVVKDILVVAPLDTERLDAFRLPDGSQAGSLVLDAARERFVTPPASAGGVVAIAASVYGEEGARVLGLDLSTLTRGGTQETGRGSPGI